MLRSLGVIPPFLLGALLVLSFNILASSQKPNAIEDFEDNENMRVVLDTLPSKVIVTTKAQNKKLVTNVLYPSSDQANFDLRAAEFEEAFIDVEELINSREDMALKGIEGFCKVV